MLKCAQILEKMNAFAPVDNDLFTNFMYNIGQWMSGETSANRSDKLLNLYQKPEIQQAVQTELHDLYDGTNTIKVYRAIDMWQEEFEKSQFNTANLTTDEIYNLKSYKRRLLFSWTTNYDFAKNWLQKEYNLLFEIETLPLDMIVFASDMFNADWENSAELLRKKYLAHTASEGSPVNLLSGFEYQHEVIVWHKKPLAAKLVYFKTPDTGTDYGD